MRNLRLYIAITTFFPLIGGAETQTFAQAQRLQERGYEPTIITFRHRNAWPEREVIGGIPVIRVAGSLLGNRQHFPRMLRQISYLLAMLVMTWNLWRHRKDYDILQVCQFSQLVLPLALLCRVTGKPMTIVVISAGAGKATKTREPARLLAGPLDASAAWLQVDGKTWVDGDLDGVARMGKFVLNFLCSTLNRISSAVIVLSSRMQKQFSNYHLPLLDIRCISNGVDVRRFHPALAEISLEEWHKTVVCVSKLRYEKGIDVLLQAWRLVHKQDPRARLVIVGSGPIEKQLARMADELGITGSVEFAGLQSDVPAQLHRGALFVLPSRWEGMPNALLEAMACGCACVATRVSGSEDLIEYGVNGLLVESEEYSAMADALLALLADAELAARYGQAAHETTTRSYTIETITDRYAELYWLLLERKQQKKHPQQPLVLEEELFQADERNSLPVGGER